MPADTLSRLADAAAVALFGDAARRLPFAVTPRMKEIASATAAPARSLVVAAYIVGTGVLHSRGTFSATLRGEGAARNASLLGLVDAMVARSPGLCAPGTSLVIVHNVDVADGLRGGVEYVRVAADGLLGRMAPNSARFVLIDRVLRTHPRYADRWACAFAVDLADVDVLRAPPCAALRDDELVIGQDGCGAKLGGWLAGRARRSGLLEHELNGSSARTRALLSGRGGGGCIYSAAIVGGRRAAFAPALATVAHQLRANFARRAAAGGADGTVPFWGEDMVVWNAIARERPPSALLAGYPHGPANLPMYGAFHPEHADEPNATMADRAETPGRRRKSCGGREACRQAWLRRVRGLHWFGHKMPSSWRWWLVEPSCRRPRPVKRARSTAWKRPLPNCTLPLCLRDS